MCSEPNLVSHTVLSDSDIWYLIQQDISIIIYSEVLSADGLCEAGRDGARLVLV